MLASCGTAGNIDSAAKTQAAVTTSGGTTPSATKATAAKISTITFATTGNITGTYTIQSLLPTSKLRHGHREFTIVVANAGKSVIMAFYGYDGPRSYMLEGHKNGGDVRIDFGKGASAWDLPMTQGISCALHITHDAPTQEVGIDSMQGSFTCPRLVSTNPATPNKFITVQSGQFDLQMVVES